jgi:hypothetical protein
MRALQHGIEVVMERLVGEVGADIKQLHVMPAKTAIVAGSLRRAKCYSE